MKREKVIIKWTQSTGQIVYYGGASEIPGFSGKWTFVKSEAMKLSRSRARKIRPESIFVKEGPNSVVHEIVE